MSVAITISITLSTAALQSYPVAIHAPIGPGSVQGAMKLTLLTNPRIVANQAIVAKINGAKMNGIISTGFITTGVPNIIGSLILKIAGTTTVFESDFVNAERPVINIANARPKVAPDPPMKINHWKNGSAAIAVGAAPVNNNAWLISINCTQIGRAMFPTIDAP